MNRLIKSKQILKHADNIRTNVIRMAFESQSAHTGGCLSCVDLLTVLYFSIMKVNIKNAQDTKRDRFVFSKAHDSKALYAVLAERGFFDKEILSRYEKNEGLPGHPTRHIVPGVEVSAGSLGHGLSLATGMAYSGKIDKKSFRIFAMLSDGECDEGSTWEAALFAGHNKLSNLIAIIDYNKIQSFGRTKDILDLEPFKQKWESFGWAVREVNGHNISEIEKALEIIPFQNKKPSVLIAHTLKGYKGVEKYVDEVASHYKPPTEEEYLEAIKKLI